MDGCVDLVLILRLRPLRKTVVRVLTVGMGWYVPMRLRFAYGKWSRQKRWRWKQRQTELIQGLKPGRFPSRWFCRTPKEFPCGFACICLRIWIASLRGGRLPFAWMLSSVTERLYRPTKWIAAKHIGWSRVMRPLQLCWRNGVVEDWLECSKWTWPG